MNPKVAPVDAGWVFPAPHAVLIMLIEIPAFFLCLAAQILSKFPWKMYFCIFQITSFAQGTLWCLQKKIFWEGAKERNSHVFNVVNGKYAS